MAKKKQPKTLRPCGRCFEVYNEGLCVYLHDAGNTEKLAKLIKKHGEEGNVFYDNLEVAAFAKAVKRQNLALAYELFQDDEIFVEVHVGEPLTEAELAVARWLSPQRAMLDLPTGKLRIDTPNTMPLDPEDHEDEAAIVDVPPGEYVLTLYRVDWKACEVDEVKYEGPQEILVLTRAEDAEPVPKTAVILEYPTEPEETGWEGNYKIAAPKFTCQVNFWDYWEWIRLNLEPKAISQLGLKCGSVLRLHAAGSSFDLIFIDDMSADDYRARVGGRGGFEKQFADRPEVGLGGWLEFGGRKVLAFFRFKSTKAVPIKFHETWKDASGEVLSESYTPIKPAAIQDATVHEGVIHAKVLFANAEMMVINALPEQVGKLGKTFKLKLPDSMHTVSFGDPDRHHLNYFLNLKSEPGGILYMRAMGLRTFARKARGPLPQWALDYPIEEIGVKERRPVTAFFSPPTSDPLSKFLQLRQMYVDGNSQGFDWAKSPEEGMDAELSGG
ncbi:hypothetical protein BH10PLA2_BH10PLA2_14310 [soil metagenome]